jgi:hypothetical protein
VAIFTLAFVRIFAAEPPSPKDLSPDLNIFLPKLLQDATWNQLFVADVRATDDGVWFLVRSRSTPVQFAVVKVGYNGQAASSFRISDAVAVGGLAVTSRGVTTVIAKPKTQATLRQYDFSGRLSSEEPLPCGSMETLLVIGDKPATVCADGIVVEHEPRAETRHSSWVRPGSAPEVLFGRRLAIVDKATAQIPFDDLDTSKISAISVNTPEIDNAVRYYAKVKDDYSKVAAPGAPAMGGGLIAMDTAADNSNLYMLLYPYPRLGPTVLKMDSNGQLLSRLRCRTPGSEVGGYHKIEAARGYLILVSSGGDVHFYKP